MQQHKNLMKKFFFMAVAVILTASMTACGSKDDTPKTISVESITISPSGDVTIEVGKTTTLSATVVPYDATNKGITWSSGSSNIATVDAQTGVVTGVSVGTATIRVAAADGSGVSATKSVTVVPPPPIRVTGITIAGDETVETGKTITLSATVTPENATNKSVTWSSVNTNIATVNAQTGVVTGVSAGTATIRATAADGSGVVANKSVTVTPVKVTAITIIPSGNVSVAERQTMTLTAIISPDNAANKNVTWSSLNTSIATINAQTGVVTGVSVGTATIRATAADGSGVIADKSVVVILAPDPTWNIGSPNSSSVQATLSGNTLTISGTGRMMDFSTAPWRSEGKHNDIRTVVIQSGVTNIGNNAFNGCENLSSVTIGTNVQTIGSSSFNQCRALTSISIPNTVTSIGSSAFANCGSLRTVRIEDDPTPLIYYSSGDSFANSPIQTLYVGRNLTHSNAPWWGDPLFNGITSLTSVTFGNSVTSIQISAFEGCTGLTQITIPNNVTSVGSYAFSGCTGLKSINMGRGVRSIEAYTFFGCRELASFTIPNHITSIGDKAFANCANLRDIRIDDDPTNLIYHSSGNSFENCPIQTLYVGRNLTNSNAPWLGEPLFNGISSLTSVTFGNNVTSIENSAFEDCTDLTQITIPNNVTSVGSYAFSGCTGLKNINIGRGVKIIESYTFYGCRELTSFTVPNHITSIGDRAFANCANLRDVRVDDDPTGLTYHYLGRSFENCPIQTLYVGRNLINSNAPWSGDPLFNSVMSLTSLTFGNNVSSIENSAFDGCRGLTQITSNRTSPPTIQSNTFNGVTRSIPVRVPSSAVTAYRNAQHWNQFTNFQGM